MYRRTDNLKVVGYFDSDFVDYVDSRKSTFGYIFMFVDGVISWRRDPSNHWLLHQP